MSLSRQENKQDTEINQYFIGYKFKLKSQTISFLVGLKSSLTCPSDAGGTVYNNRRSSTVSRPRISQTENVNWNTLILFNIVSKNILVL